MANNPNLENLFAIEVIGENMCKYLDCKSILNVKKASKTLYEAMEKQRVAWIRTVQTRFTIRTGKEELPESWKEIVYKLTTENLEKLGLGLALNHRIYEGMTPLHVAARMGHLGLCQSILGRVENKNPGDNDGRTPLQYAAGSGHEEVYRAIANECEDKNPGGIDGMTPLHKAVFGGFLSICQFILDRVDDKNPGDNEGRTPLHDAAAYGHEEVYKAIANEIEEKNPADNYGETPLHKAVSRKDLEICRFIIDRVDEKNPLDNDGVTPLALAHQLGFSEIVELFK